MLSNALLRLRALEPDDLDWLYALENDSSLWEVSYSEAPISRFTLQQYLEQAGQGPFEARQLRLVMQPQTGGHPIGLIDLFDLDPIHRRAGVGLLIVAAEHRRQGYGRAALDLVAHYAQQQLQLHQLYANIREDNAGSVALFTTFGFEKVGVKRQWQWQAGRYHDEALYQLIFHSA